MDFRQYDNAIGRFSSIDLLAELSFSQTPYHFGNNNPNYWADPSGLQTEPNPDPVPVPTPLDDVAIQNNYHNPPTAMTYLMGFDKD
jgi:uncharacterized protein RhaS with RHS repeats